MASSKRDWKVVFLLISGRVVTHDLDLSEEMTERETMEFISKQLDRGEWWFLEDGVSIHTSSVESYYLSEYTQRTSFSKE
ncbi:hypothetical protein LF817_04435 [Halobacillus sp. A1]|uniref:hypothetical protein n=1 Tax=Halobacillus sp. A1 TaxID=2880262 RepID=UPI0020A67BBD|nr:hypothetical protein [Halobacillus sp. A1]MCP3030581.1 hypothetical protein [Halobacillus sp. A1]